MFISNIQLVNNNNEIISIMQTNSDFLSEMTKLELPRSFEFTSNTKFSDREKFIITYLSYCDLITNEKINKKIVDEEFEFIINNLISDKKHVWKLPKEISTITNIWSTQQNEFQSKKHAAIILNKDLESLNISMNSREKIILDFCWYQIFKHKNKLNSEKTFSEFWLSICLFIQEFQNKPKQVLSIIKEIKKFQDEIKVIRNSLLQK